MLNVAFLIASQSIVIYPLGVPLTVAAKAYLNRFGMRRQTAMASEQGSAHDTTPLPEDGNASRTQDDGKGDL